jgi:benzoate membrane transport protein
MNLRLPPSAWSSALAATLVGFGGTVVLVVQALQASGASAAQIGGGVTAVCLGISAAGAVLSIRFRLPIVLAWSTPGAALLAAAPPGASWSVAVGAFIAAALMTLALGAIPALGRCLQRLPTSVAAAMLAGVLLPFCLGFFRTGAKDPLQLIVVLGVFLLARRRLPRYALLIVLVAGAALMLLRGSGPPFPTAALVALSPTRPSLELEAIFSLGLPLFLVTLMSQNLPGLAVLRAAGYVPPVRALLVGTGVASLAMAPFGALGVNLAALTASLCTSEDAHPEREQRWKVGVLYAGFYLLLAVISPWVVRLFVGLPPTLIAALAGVALIPALQTSLENMLASRDEREPAVVTFLAAGSGITLFGVGSAFWGLAAGFLALGAKALVGGKGVRSVV